MSAFTDTLKALVANIQKNSATFGIDSSNDRMKSEGYALALSTVMNTMWESAYSPEQGKYIVYPRDVSAARAWVAEQVAKKSAVAVQWWPMVSPTVMKKTIPLAVGVFAAGFIFAKVIR